MDELLQDEYFLNIMFLEDIPDVIDKTNNDTYFPYDIIYDEKIKRINNEDIQSLLPNVIKNKKKLQSIKDTYFPYYPSLYYFNYKDIGLLKTQLCISPTGKFSSSRKEGVEFIMSCIVDTYKNKNVHCFSFIDGTGNIGTDTIGFILLTSGKVYSIEINHDDYIILVNNVQCYNFRNDKQYTLIHGDSLHVIPSIIEKHDAVDIIFFDPPWGGTTYKKNDKIQLVLSGKNIATIVKEYIINGYVTEGIILKVPSNFDIDHFTSIVNTEKIQIDISIIIKNFEKQTQQGKKLIFTIIIVKIK